MNIRNIPKSYDIYKVSDPKLVREKADEIGFSNVEIYLSSRKNKKYMLVNPFTNKVVHFGDKRYQDYTK